VQGLYNTKKEENRMTIVKRALQTVSKELKDLAKKTDQLIKTVDRLEKERSTKKRKTAAKAKTKRKAPAKGVAKKAGTRKTVAKKKSAPTATAQVLSVIKKSKKGVDVPTLIKKTGFEDKQIRNIVFRAFKQGKIKRAGRGAYIGA
jgi:septal ring factor EnvC (AmiA/AmiB activator)